MPDFDVKALLHGFRDRKVLVVGDLVLDHYITGKVSRISPEAPVPVVSLHDHGEKWIPGGAANVAMNVLSMGAKPVLAGIVGDDNEGGVLLNLLDEAGVDTACVVSTEDRPTTTKTRVTSRNQQLMRIDREKDHLLPDDTAALLLSGIQKVFDVVEAVIIEDYDKGVLSAGLIEAITTEARKRRLYVAVDPRVRNFWNYRRCNLFKPNRHEAGRALGTEIDSLEKAGVAAAEIQRRLEADSVLVTLGPGGSVFVGGDEDGALHLPTLARHVFDVSGAGDSVIAVMGLSGACGYRSRDAATLANMAAAAVCAEPGVYAVKPEDILKEAARYVL